MQMFQQKSEILYLVSSQFRSCANHLLHGRMRFLFRGPGAREPSPSSQSGPVTVDV